VIILDNFANARVESLIREAGAFRVSAGAISSLNDIIWQYGLTIAKKAVAIAETTGRKTIKDADIATAHKMI
jgi:histone H3/H4